MLVLPSSADWTWGSRQDPLWNPNLEGFEGRVFRHATWTECLRSLIDDGRRVLDFYFQVSEDRSDDGDESAERLDAGDELLIWSFGDKPDTGRIDIVTMVADVDHASIRSFMIEAFYYTKTRLREENRDIGWEPDDREFKKRGWFFDNLVVSSFEKFKNEVGAADARNLVFDVHVAAAENGRNVVRIWMTHPGRGAGREFRIDDVDNHDLSALSDLMADHLAVHARNFGWALADVQNAIGELRATRVDSP